MKLHLNYDGQQENGVIFNSNYNGAMFHGPELKPDLSFDFISFVYTEVFERQGNRVINLDGTERKMTQSEIDEIIPIANDWVQPLGQEGNPTQDQIDQRAAIDLRNAIQEELDKAVITVDEMVFQADEKSINMMTASILASQSSGATEIKWKLADNNISTVKVDQLKKVQVLAMDQLASIKGI